jgi:hypothetical protein
MPQGMLSNSSTQISIIIWIEKHCQRFIARFMP